MPGDNPYVFDNDRVQKARPSIFFYVAELWASGASEEQIRGIFDEAVEGVESRVAAVEETEEDEGQVVPNEQPADTELPDPEDVTPAEETPEQEEDAEQTEQPDVAEDTTTAPEEESVATETEGPSGLDSEA